MFLFIGDITLSDDEKGDIRMRIKDARLKKWSEDGAPNAIERNAKNESTALVLLTSELERGGMPALLFAMCQKRVVDAIYGIEEFDDSRLDFVRQAFDAESVERRIELIRFLLAEGEVFHAQYFMEYMAGSPDLPEGSAARSLAVVFEISMSNMLNGHCDADAEELRKSMKAFLHSNLYSA